MRGLCKEEDYAFLGESESMTKGTTEGLAALEDGQKDVKEERVRHMQKLPVMIKIKSQLTNNVELWFITRFVLQVRRQLEWEKREKDRLREIEECKKVRKHTQKTIKSSKLWHSMKAYSKWHHHSFNSSYLFACQHTHSGYSQQPIRSLGTDRLSDLSLLKLRTYENTWEFGWRLFTKTLSIQLLFCSVFSNVDSLPSWTCFDKNTTSIHHTRFLLQSYPHSFVISSWFIGHTHTVMSEYPLNC